MFLAAGGKERIYIYLKKGTFLLCRREFSHPGKGEGGGSARAGGRGERERDGVFTMCPPGRKKQDHLYGLGLNCWREKKEKQRNLSSMGSGRGKRGEGGGGPLRMRCT